MTKYVLTIYDANSKGHGAWYLFKCKFLVAGHSIAPIKYVQLPHDIKAVRVTPIHKKNSKLDAGNHRPVSILSRILKLFERIVYNSPVLASSTLPIPVWQISQIISNRNKIKDTI